MPNSVKGLSKYNVTVIQVNLAWSFMSVDFVIPLYPLIGYWRNLDHEYGTTGEPLYLSWGILTFLCVVFIHLPLLKSTYNYWLTLFKG